MSMKVVLKADPIYYGKWTVLSKLPGIEESFSTDNFSIFERNKMKRTHSIIARNDPLPSPKTIILSAGRRGNSLLF